MKKVKQILYKNLLHISAFIVLTLASGLLAINLGQDANYDLYNYHYNSPYSILNNAQDRQLAVSGVLSYENPARDIPGYLLMNNLSPKQAGFALGLIQGINLWLIFEIGLLVLSRLGFKRIIASVFSLTCAFLALYGAGNHSETGTTMGDNVVSIFVLLGLYFFLLSEKTGVLAKKSMNFKLLGAISIGLSVGLKLTSVVYFLGYSVMTAVFIIKNYRNAYDRIKKLLVFVLGSSLGVLAVSGYWMLSLVFKYGNPIFPFYNGIFKSIFYPPVNFIDERWVNAPLVDAVFEPFSYFELQSISSEIPFADARVAVMLVAIAALIFALLFMKILLSKKVFRKKLFTISPLGYLLVFVIVSYTVWAAQFSYYRYIIVLEMLSPLIVIGILSYIVKSNRYFSSALLLALAIYLLNTTQYMSWGRVHWQETMFGIKKTDFTSLEDSTVILSGYGPLSFLLPYLPDSTHSVRILSNLSHTPYGKSAEMNNLIYKKIEERKKINSQFYLFYADEDEKSAMNTLKEHNFVIYECKELPVAVRVEYKYKYRLCKLVSL